MTVASAVVQRQVFLPVQTTPGREVASSHRLSPSIWAALALLGEARDLALAVEYDAWDFAVEIRTLQRAGATTSQLRWLICKGLVEHGRETTQAGQNQRSFDLVHGLELADDTCFILTSAGWELVRRGLAGPGVVSGNDRLLACNGVCRAPATTPTWDRLRQELRLGNVVVKRFKVPAANQERILAVFEEEGWPCRVDDPLPPRPGQDCKRRLHDTINSLNRNQKHPLVRFLGDGSGRGVRWELGEPAGFGTGQTRVTTV